MWGAAKNETSIVWSAEPGLLSVLVRVLFKLVVQCDFDQRCLKDVAGMKLIWGSNWGVIKVRGDSSFRVNSSQCFGEQSADRSTDDSYIIAQMEVGGLYKLGPRSGAPFISSLSLLHVLSLSSLRTRSSPAKELTDWTHTIYKWVDVRRHVHTSHNISIEETWWLSLSVACPICTGLAGDPVWFRLHPHVWVSCGIFAQDKQKVWVSIKCTGQIPRIICRYDWNIVHLHANAAMKGNFQVCIFDKGRRVHDMLEVQVV